MIKFDEITLDRSVSVIDVQILEAVFRAFLKALIDAAIGAGRAKGTSFLPTRILHE